MNNLSPIHTDMVVRVGRPNTCVCTQHWLLTHQNIHTYMYVLYWSWATSTRAARKGHFDGEEVHLLTPRLGYTGCYS